MSHRLICSFFVDLSSLSTQHFSLPLSPSTLTNPPLPFHTPSPLPPIPLLPLIDRDGSGIITNNTPSHSFCTPPFPSQGFNVIVDSCAGSGKTTTVLHLAKAMPQKNMLLLTYNSRLKEETRGSVKSLDLSNLECHSYHACCQKYFSKEPCLNDKVIKKIINNSNPSAQNSHFMMSLSSTKRKI